MKVRTKMFEGTAVQWNGHNSAEVCEFLGLKESWLEGENFVAEPMQIMFGMQDYWVRIHLNEWVVLVDGITNYCSNEEFNRRYETI